MIKLTLVHSPSGYSIPHFVMVFSIFLDSLLHISDWAIGSSKQIAFLKALVMAWSCLTAYGHILILSTKANLPHYVTSASSVSFFFIHTLQRSFFLFLS